jgi:hypothetical protein
MRLVASMAMTLILAGCSGAPTTGTTSAPPSAGVSASLPAQTAAASPSPASPSAASSAIVGEWVRTASCEEALAAFTEAGLLDQVPAWVVGNYVGEGATAAPGKECANAKPAVPHSHFFTADGRFGSRDENGQDVDDGGYQVVDSDTLSFGSHAQEFGHAGDILVDYSVEGDQVTFQVKVPTPCDPACRVAYGWAMSAFFGPRPFDRT